MDTLYSCVLDTFGLIFWINVFSHSKAILSLEKWHSLLLIIFWPSSGNFWFFQWNLERNMALIRSDWKQKIMLRTILGFRANIVRSRFFDPVFHFCGKWTKKMSPICLRVRINVKAIAICISCTGCSLNIVFFLKILLFFWPLPVLLQRWCSTCLVCVHTLTPRENRERPESGIFENLWKKHNI